MPFKQGSIWFRIMLPLEVLLLSPPAQSHKPKQANSQIIKVQVDMVSLPVVVTTGNGKPVTNLSRDDFLVFEDNVQQKIEGFAAVAEPFSVALMLDASGSTKLQLGRIRREAIRFTKLLPRQDSVAIFSFGEDITLLQDFTTDRQRLASTIDKIRAGGFTVLYEAIWQGIREVLKPRHERSALVLFSDGVDTASDKVTKVKTQTMAKESRAAIYCIYFNTHEDVQGRQYLMDLADNSGGMVFEATKVEDLRPAFKAIARELTSQYSIGYYATNPNHDGRYRKVDLKVKRPDLYVQTRKGYWSPDDTIKKSWFNDCP